MRVRPTDRRIARLAFPAIGALAADPLLSLTDTVLVGGLGLIPLAALGVNAAVFTTIFVTFNFLVYGTTAAVARLRGSGDPDGAGRHVAQALWLAIALGLAATLLLQSGATRIVRLIGADGALEGPTLEYLRVRSFAAMPFLIVMVGHGMYRGMLDTRTPMRIAVATNLANVILSATLIYPVGLGVAGAAWGTLIAQTGAALTFLRLGSRIVPPGTRGFELRRMRTLIKVSRHLFLRTLSLLTGTLITTAVAVRMGVTVIAGHQIVREVWTLLALTLDGLAIAAQGMVGTAIGQSRTRYALALTKRLLRWGAVAGLVLAPVILALGGLAPRLFTRDAAVLSQVGQAWWILAIILPMGGIVFVADGILIGSGDFRFLMWSTGLSALAVLAPIAVASAALGWGITGLWSGMAAMLFTRLAASLWRILSGGFIPAPQGEA